MKAWFAALPVGVKLAAAVGLFVAFVLSVTFLLKEWRARDERLIQVGRVEVQGRWNAEKAARQEARADFQIALAASLAPQFDQLAAQISRIDAAGSSIDVRLPALTAAEPRYVDPRCDLTPEVLEQVNAARSLSSVTP